MVEFLVSQLGDATEVIMDAVDYYVQPYWNEYAKPHWDEHVQPHIEASVIPLWANLITWVKGKLVL